MIRVVLPTHLRVLAKVSGEVKLTLCADTSLDQLLDALEDTYPVLCGTIRDRHTGRRRALVRFFACEQDLSNTDPAAPLPEDITAGREPLFIVGAIAGG